MEHVTHQTQDLADRLQLDQPGTSQVGKDWAGTCKDQ